MCDPTLFPKKMYPRFLPLQESILEADPEHTEHLADASDRAV
jgi:hypothetical protein